MEFQYDRVLNFWFNELNPKQWWIKDQGLDEKIKTRFKNCHKAAMTGELTKWRETAHGRLAEIIVLDQFSRNIYRDTPYAFSQDAQALTLSQELVSQKLYRNFTKDEKLFAFLPYMHSESIMVHEQAVQIFKMTALDLEFEIKHKVIIEKFGRYPHRNEILGRTSTPAEIEFLKTPNSSF